MPLGTLMICRTSACAENDFLVFRGQHAGHGGFDVVDGVINDPVGADIDFFVVRGLAGVGVGPDIEADDQSVGGRSQHDIGFVDGADAGMDDVDTDFFVLEVFQRLAQGFDGALNIGFDNDVEIFDLAFLNLFEQIFQGDFRGLADFFAALLGLPFFGDSSARSARRRHGEYRRPAAHRTARALPPEWTAALL